MGYAASIITMNTLTAQSTAASGAQLNPIDLSGLACGMITANFSVAGTTLTPIFELSDDNGTTWATCPSALLAAPAAITATGLFFYPFLLPISLPWGRVRWAAPTGSFTGSFKFVGRR